MTARRPRPQPAIVLVDKPGGITSHDAVARARRAFGTRKVGHAGTLDPMATGLLVLGVEGATRLLTYIVGLGKTYEATIRLGVATDTDDAEGSVISTTDAAHVTSAAIAEGIAALTGDIEQVPSTYSAIKVDGRRAYDLARAGEEVELKARAVTVSRFDVVAERRGESTIDLDVVVDCSSGTYIRSLARDLGASLGVGGHLTALRRTRIGGFDVRDAVQAGDLADLTTAGPAAAAGHSTDAEPATLEPATLEPATLDPGPTLERATHSPVPTPEPASPEPEPTADPEPSAAPDAPDARGDRPARAVLTPAAAASAVLPRLDVTADEARDLRHGKRLTGAAARLAGAPAAAIDPDGVLVGIVEKRGADVKSAMNMPEEAPG